MARRGQGKFSRPGQRSRPTIGSPPARPATPPPILLVEDEASLREILGHILEQEGHRVVTAANGREALQQLERELPSLVITDLMMPVLDGHELLDRLDTIVPDVPVIVLSEVDRPRLRTRLNVARVMRKPVTLDALLQVVASFVTPG